MVQCFAPGCNHRHPSDCKMFLIPKDKQGYKKWVKYLSVRVDRKPSNTTYVCSCHFKDGKKENGPTIFLHNINKQFDFDSPEKRRRAKRTSKTSPTASVSPTGATTSFQVEHASLSPSQRENEEIKQLQENIFDLRNQLCEAQAQAKFSYEQIKHDNRLVNLYTGLSDAETFNCLENYLKSLNFKYYLGWQVTSFKMCDQLLITLMKLRLNSPHLDLAQRFKCSESTISNIFITFIHLLHRVLYQEFMSKIPSVKKTRTCLPNSFAIFGNCRIILDCTEIKIAVPSSMEMQRQTYSNYKHANTFKALVGVAPNGVIVFVSNLYPGSTSDKQMFRESNLYDQLVAGDMILVDKGFLIHDVVPAGVTVNVPPFLRGQQFSREEAISTLNIARCRVHIERANSRIKSFRILHYIPSTLKPFASIVFQVCCSLVNLQNPLIDEIEPLLSID